MTTNDYFDQEMRVMTPDKVMQPRAFALCWDTADEAERRRRGQKLQHLATDALGTGGFGVAPEAFKAAWMACRQAYREDPAAFLEQYLETGSWFSSAALMAQKLPELHYVVEGFLAQGLALLASPPKYGKSWLAMQLCLAVSEGQPFLGMPTRQATCLYLALEDGRQRLQKRLGRLGSHGSRSLYFETNAPTLAGGLLVYLESFLARHPDCRLVVVDTLQKVRGDGDRASSVYAADYADVGALKAFADRFGLCLLLVHHLRKMSDDTDPFNRIAGSNGIFGAADAALVLTRAKREDAQTTLDLTGRDVEDKRLVLRNTTPPTLWCRPCCSSWTPGAASGRPTPRASLPPARTPAASARWTAAPPWPARWKSWPPSCTSATGWPTAQPPKAPAGACTASPARPAPEPSRSPSLSPTPTERQERKERKERFSGVERKERLERF